MKIFNHPIDKSEVVKKYFSDPEKRITLKEGDVLLHQYAINHRIFYIQEGKLIGLLPDKPHLEPIFEATAGSFAGVYSYCSEDHHSYSQVMATHPTVVYYSEVEPEKLHEKERTEYLALLFHIVVLELKSRQQFAAEMALERHQVMNKLIKTEKLATLGQLSAGLAHELNNAIGSLSANLRQLELDMEALLLQHQTGPMKAFFEQGLDDGYRYSSQEVRENRKQWSDRKALDPRTVKKLSQAGIAPKKVQTPDEAKNAAGLWSLGCIMHDMKVAATQAGHVINSIKSMGISNQNWSKDVDVNKTILEATAILRSLTRTIALDLDLKEGLPRIEACHGELVQVWVNLVKNAVESLTYHPVENPNVTIRSEEVIDQVQVTIIDNGPGISKEVIEKIFEPNFTTKVKGISLGLGLGLTIVQRIVLEHDGTLRVTSEPGDTRFIVTLNKP